MKISEVSKKYDIPVDTLRYYEKAGLLPNVRKNSSGIRDYSESDCGWVEFIILTKHHASCCQNQDPGFRSNI